MFFMVIFTIFFYHIFLPCGRFSTIFLPYYGQLSTIFFTIWLIFYHIFYHMGDFLPYFLPYFAAKIVMVSTILLCLYWLFGPHGRSGGTYSYQGQSAELRENMGEQC